MARSRSLTTEFIKLLNATESPLYAVDDQWRLIFVNAACAAWVEIEAEALQGQVCRYHSAECATAGEAVAAALCPPPETMQGYRISAEVGIRVAGTARIRRCEFHPLLDASGGVVGVLGFLAGTDGKTDADQIDHKEENWHVTLRRHRETLRGRYQVDQILGESAAMRRVRRQVELAVGSRARVLIVGSESTGRRHVARAIHYARGGEADDTLVPLACSLLDREMLRTAWNSLRWTQKQDETRHMVVLLEDVDQLSEAGQADLARWLRDDSGMRVLATSQQKLDQLVDEGRYVAELAEALGTLVIEIPPLASRPEDIPLLAQALLETINAEGTKQLSGCTPEALDRLSAYTWPGNLEELAEILKLRA